MRRLMGKPGRIRSKEDFGKSAIVIGCLIASWCEYRSCRTAARPDCRANIIVLIALSRYLLYANKRVQQMDVSSPSSAVPLALSLSRATHPRLLIPQV